MTEHETVQATTPDVPMCGESTENPTNYRKLYREKCTELKTAEAKIAELEHICKSLAEQKAQVESQLKQATLEYNTRVQFMLDASKHAYLSMQLAVAANNGGNQ